jgi:hypothetical protein
MKAGEKVHRKANLRRGNLVFHDLNRDGELNDHYRDHVSICLFGLTMYHWFFLLCRTP